jgi:hypothetical protein
LLLGSKAAVAPLGSLEMICIPFTSLLTALPAHASWQTLSIPFTSVPNKA